MHAAEDHHSFVLPPCCLHGCRGCQLCCVIGLHGAMKHSIRPWLQIFLWRQEKHEPDMSAWPAARLQRTSNATCAPMITPAMGRARGRASIPDTIADINAVFQWLIRRKGIQRQDIILYGQSLGSGPTLDLGSRERGIAGVVLHAAFASGTLHTCPGPWVPHHCQMCFTRRQTRSGTQSHELPVWRWLGQLVWQRG